MSIDTRGFEYALEPVRQRSHHRVEMAASRLGQTQRDLGRAREQVEATVERCRALAALCTPAAKATIDPNRAVAVARQMLALREALAEARMTVADKERAVAQAQGELDKARIERETFETHRADLLAEHAQEQSRRFQAQADQDWLARRSYARASGASPTNGSEDETR